LHLGGAGFSLWGLLARTLCLAAAKTHRLNRLRKKWRLVIPKGGFCPRNLLFLGFGEEKQIPRFARDDKKALFPQPVQPVAFAAKLENQNPTG